MDDCKLASERGNELREAVLAECRRQGLGAWDRREQKGFLRNLVIREGRRTGSSRSGSSPRPASSTSTR